MVRASVLGFKSTSRRVAAGGEDGISASAPILRVGDVLGTRWLTLRIQSELKRRMEAVAAQEGRIVAQICEALLLAGLTVYQREGTKYIRRLLTRPENGK
jgi:hypothetical protein